MQGGKEAGETDPATTGGIITPSGLDKIGRRRPASGASEERQRDAGATTPDYPFTGVTPMGVEAV